MHRRSIRASAITYLLERQHFLYFYRFRKGRDRYGLFSACSRRYGFVRHLALGQSTICRLPYGKVAISWCLVLCSFWE